MPICGQSDRENAGGFATRVTEKPSASAGRAYLRQVLPGPLLIAAGILGRGITLPSLSWLELLAGLIWSRTRA
ncbi:hypothetical protein AB0H00_22070 [Nocardia sp. NPDC023852]|uniref:hypothetical protein n=1 Tax=Nocardia sp. NPDC023852 TaxID=3154697 RepID=UPI0033C184BA